MKRLMIVAVALVSFTTFSCKSYCGRGCVNRHSSVTPKKDTIHNSDVTLLEETSEFN
ncbi:hypothetical protein [Neptunitalea chrysea]|uniref:hypothetical protein n=1 Tax=Neptunitalea chrysea TaxID=1647581 RepID=UPI002492A04D|nr:hypothetical protein [Neptunitalea chrysea]